MSTSAARLAVAVLLCAGCGQPPMGPERPALSASTGAATGIAVSVPNQVKALALNPIVCDVPVTTTNPGAPGAWGDAQALVADYLDTWTEYWSSQDMLGALGTIPSGTTTGGYLRLTGTGSTRFAATFSLALGSGSSVDAITVNTSCVP